MPGAGRARSLVCKSKKAHKHSHHGHTGIARHSPRNGFNGFLRALPGDRACLPPSPAKVTFRELDASVGASGPHDFAVRDEQRSSLRPSRPSHPSPNVRDDREAPLLAGVERQVLYCCVYQTKKRNIFCKRAGHDGQINAANRSNH